MKRFQCYLFVLYFLINSLSLCGQVIYPDKYFRLPLDLPMSLSGSFGEIRPNHLHSGIDLRTNQEEGYPVYAVADGYVSRIHVQAWGFGYSLYIDHPNGYTTVYGHLQRFNDKITTWLQQSQYALQQFEVDLFPKPGELPVLKNDVVALTGSSGASGGPHLHYEIRNTVTEYPINPLFFGYNLPDTIPPRFKGQIRIIPLKGRGRVNGKSIPVDFLISQTDENTYRLSSSKPIEVSGEIAIGVEVLDFQNGNTIPTGVYSIGYYLDDICYTLLRLETFSFSQNRAANSILDYAECIKSDHRFIRSFVEPWNPLKIYDIVKNNGVFKFTDNAKHVVRCVVKDFHGNASELSFSVKSKVANLKPAIHSGYRKIFYGNKNNTYKTLNMEISMPKGDLYDTLYFTYHMGAADRRLVSTVHNIHDKYTPVHDSYTLKIRTKSLKPELSAKAVMVSLNDDGSLISQGGEWSNGFMTAKVRSFGRFGVAIDTIAPVIRPLTNFNKKSYIESGVIQFYITDNLSGIKSYRGYLNGNWVLMSFDGKSSKLTLELNEHTPKGENTLKVELEDGVGNKTIFEKTFEN